MNKKPKGSDEDLRRLSTPDLSAEIEKLALSSLRGLLEAMFDDADDTLFGMAEKAEDNRSQALHFDTMRALRMDRPSILDNFASALSDSLHGRISETDETAAGQPASIELQDMDSLEKSIAITNMAGRGLQLCGQQYPALETRLEWLVQNSRVQLCATALSPRQICEAFGRSMDAVDLDIETRLLVYKLFDLIVVARLSEFYLALSRYMDAESVPTDLPTKTSATQAAPGISENHQTYSSDTYSPGALTSGHGADPQSAPNHSQQVVSTPYPGMPANDHASTQLTANTRVFAALNSLQEQVARRNDSALLNREWMHVQLRDAFMLAGPQPASDAMVHNQDRLFDLLSSLFNDLLTDTSLSDPVKVLLARLEIPVIKIALVDPEFLRKHRHPARELLGEIALLGGRIENEKSELFAAVKTQVEVLLKDFDQDMRVIERVLLALRELSIREATRHLSERRARRRAENTGITNVAKQAVLRELRYQARGKMLPEPLKEFVLRAWGPYMGLQYAKHGADSVAWRKSARMLARLVDSVQPDVYLGDTATIHDDRALLLRELRQALKAGGLLEVALERFIGDLGDYFSRMDQQWDSDTAEQAEFETEEREPQSGPMEKILQMLGPALTTNTWFQLYTGPEHKHGRWLKLLSHNTEKDQLCFANHRGQIVATKTLLELAEEICDGRSRPIFSNDRKFHKLQADLTFAMHSTGRAVKREDKGPPRILDAQA